MLEAKSVTRQFGGLVAVNNVTLNVAEQEIVGLIGPNGAGKTTLFNLIVGVLPLNAGQVHFDGQNISGKDTAQICNLGLARTFQIPQLFNSMTVLETVMVGAFAHRASIREAEQHAHTVLELVGLDDRCYEKPGTLTIAGKKRLEIARALATDPRMILLDEVMAGLNQPEVLKLLDLIRTLRTQGMTVLLVEHNIEAVFSVADRIVVLDRGEKIADGDPKQVLNDEKVVKAYLGGEYVAA